MRVRIYHRPTLWLSIVTAQHCDPVWSQPNIVTQYGQRPTLWVSMVNDQHCDSVWSQPNIGTQYGHIPTLWISMVRDQHCDSVWSQPNIVTQYGHRPTLWLSMVTDYDFGFTYHSIWVNIWYYDKNKWVFDQSVENKWVVVVYLDIPKTREIALHKKNESVLQPRLVKHELVLVFITYYP